MLEFFATMPNNETGRNTEIVEYAPKLTKQEIKEIFLGRTYEPIGTVYKGTDLSYSVLRATAEEKELIEWCKKEHDSIIGKLYRQEKENKHSALRRQYGKAAFYPVRLLEEKIVLYGAGKFGRDLYRRLKEDSEHEVVMWVDKNVYACRQSGLKEVVEPSEIGCTYDEQIVIAVMGEALAGEIMEELKQSGVQEERMVWLRPYYYPNMFAVWETEDIG